MDREFMIKTLIDDDINGWNDREDEEAYLTMILRDGHIGYKDWQDQDLENELHDRGILEEDKNA